MLVEAEVAGFNGLLEGVDLRCDSGFERRKAGANGGDAGVRGRDALSQGNQLALDGVETFIHPPVHATKEPPHVLKGRILVRHGATVSLALIQTECIAPPLASSRSKWQNRAQSEFGSKLTFAALNPSPAGGEARPQTWSLFRREVELAAWNQGLVNQDGSFGSRIPTTRGNFKRRSLRWSAGSSCRLRRRRSSCVGWRGPKTSRGATSADNYLVCASGGRLRLCLPGRGTVRCRGPAVAVTPAPA